MKIKNRCPWCKCEDTYLLGASGFKSLHHCMGCSSDFWVDYTEYAWTAEQVKEHDKQYKKDLALKK